jgi:hypothetical protein
VVQARQLALLPVSAVVLTAAFDEPRQPQRVRWQSPKACSQSKPVRRQQQEVC